MSRIYAGTATENACLRLLDRLTRQHPEATGPEIHAMAVDRCERDIQLFSGEDAVFVGLAAKRLDWLRARAPKETT